ncbi:hypothetical protein TEA_008994 [Camellia sinensis var. sinensis]|uniref:glutathione transferase n=1 Tax=Camellia sinensis var. sinensis TaxID=542762 RepID=A0A4V3WKR3_CAMSN|nr:hypothetical protein TEA_008994 [Camellia sinensis var. sinensis]
MRYIMQVRRGADRAEIYSLVFSSTAQWLAVSSDKGTVHVFGLKANLGNLGKSRAITAYIAEKYKDTSYDLIRHKNLKEAAQVKVWLEVESQQFNPPISAIIFQCFFAPMYGMKTDQAVVDANVEKLGKVLDVYEARLAKSKYLAGDFYSLADLHHLGFTHYLFKTPYASVFNERPRVKSWWEDISSRPVFKKISPAMSFGDK